MSQMHLKCRMCRKELIDSSNFILTGHNLLLNPASINYASPDSDCQDVVNNFYLDELGLPEWLTASVNEAGWKKGKVKCPKCSARLGSFDFVSGRKCNCAKCVLPPVHIIKGKVDYKVIEPS